MMKLPTSLLRHIDLCQRELPALSLPENYNPSAALEEYTISTADDELVKIPVWLNGSIYDLGDLLDIYNADGKIDYEKIKLISVNAPLKIKIEIIIPFGDESIVQTLGIADIQPLTKDQLDTCKRNLIQIAQSIEEYNRSVSTSNVAAAPALCPNATPITELSPLPIDEWSAPPKKALVKTDEKLTRESQIKFDSDSSPSAAAAPPSQYTGQMFSPPTSFVAKPSSMIKKINAQISIGVGFGNIAACISHGYKTQEFHQNHQISFGIDEVITGENFSLLTKPLQAEIFLKVFSDIPRFRGMIEGHLHNKSAIILCLNLEISELELQDIFVSDLRFIRHHTGSETLIFIFAYNSTSAKLPDFLDAYGLPCFIINPYTGAGVNKAFDSVIETVAKQRELKASSSCNSSSASYGNTENKNKGGCRMM